MMGHDAFARAVRRDRRTATDRKHPGPARPQPRPLAHAVGTHQRAHRRLSPTGVGESSDDAQTGLQQAVGEGYRGIPAEALITGTIDEVAAQFRAFGDLVRHLVKDQPKALGSLERLERVRLAVG